MFNKFKKMIKIKFFKENYLYIKKKIIIKNKKLFNKFNKNKFKINNNYKNKLYKFKF
jgi:hypothetical protein